MALQIPKRCTTIIAIGITKKAPRAAILQELPPAPLFSKRAAAIPSMVLITLPVMRVADVDR